MDFCSKEQSEHVNMSDNRNSPKEHCSKSNETHAALQIDNQNETGYNGAETVVHEKKDMEEYSRVDLFVKLGNGTAVYNISKSLERVRCMMNTISVEDMLSSPILPHHRCVTYISEAQRTIKGNQKEHVFKFVSSYPSSGCLSRKYRIRAEVPVIIIGDVTNVQEDQCSYVFICAYMSKFAAHSDEATKALRLLGTYSSSAEESSDSSDDGSSTVYTSDSSSNDFSSSDEEKAENNKNSNKIVKKREGVKTRVLDIKNPLVFLEDGVADKLPPVRECDVKVLKENCIGIGFIMYVHELLISVQGYKDSPALNADTLLFLEDNEDEKSLRSLGFIYEVIGPVDEPVYCITFKEGLNSEKKQVKQGAPVFISPTPEYTHFVFVQDLLKLKGSDASWKNDVEPPEQFIEYSDDEEERLAKQRLKKSSSNESSTNTAVKRKNIDESNPEKATVNKLRKTVQNGVSLPHSTEIKAEVAARHMPSARTKQNGIGPYHTTNSSQQMPHPARVQPPQMLHLPNRPADPLVKQNQPARIQQRGFNIHSMPIRLAGPAVEQNQPAQFQQHGFTMRPTPTRLAGPAVEQNQQIQQHRFTVQPMPTRSAGPAVEQNQLAQIQQHGFTLRPTPTRSAGPAVEENQRARIQQHGFTMRPLLTRPIGPAVELNQRPWMQQHGFSTHHFPTRLADPAIEQCPPRMQQYSSAMNRLLPPPLFPPRQHLIPPFQHRANFNSPDFPRSNLPFPSSQRQFFNPPP